MEMKNICRMVLLGAGIILSLAGCQKGNTPGEQTGKAVKFSATSGSIETRTAFSGEGTGTTTDEFGRKILSHERINWIANEDKIMIASDYATIYGDPTTKYATYTIASVRADGDKSYATLAEKNGNEELFFNEEHDKYAFWGIYPAEAGKGTDLVQAKASFELPATQAPYGDPVTANSTDNTKTLTTYAADMSKAVQLAAAVNQTEGSPAELDFYPSFTAFEITLCTKDNSMMLKKVVISRSDDKGMTGAVEAQIATGGNSSYTLTYNSDKAITYNFPGDNGVEISPTKYVSFTVLAVPEDIQGLNLEFHMGDGSITKATLKTKATDTAAAGPITFAGCKKHCLRGIAVPGGWKFLWLDIEVMDWVEVSTTQDNDKNCVQASQFGVSFAGDPEGTEVQHNLRYVKGNDKDYRQCWVFGTNNTVTVQFKIMMPSTGTFSIEKCGDTGDFTVTAATTPASTVTTSGNTISGTLAEGATYITLTINSTATEVKTLYFKTTASDGTSTFNLDSETQLYDMRGYHYFIVNGTASTTFADLTI
jgi:hypothetical protein